MGQIARVETLPLSSRAAQPTRPPSLIHRGDRPRTAGNFSLLFSLFSLFFIPPPFSSSFPFLLSFSLFFPSLGWMSLFYSGRNKGREPPLLYIYFFFGRRGEEVFSNERANPRAILEVWRRKGGGGRRGGPGFCAESLVNGCPTRAPSLSLSLSLSTFSSLLVLGRWLSPCRATPRDARRSYGPPGVPGHSSGNRSASVARGTR